MKHTNNQLFTASTVTNLDTNPTSVSHKILVQTGRPVRSHNQPCSNNPSCANCGGNHRSSNVCPVFKSLSSVIAYSYRNENPTSIKQLNFYQDQNHDIIALQETIVKRALSQLKIGKQKVIPPSWIKSLGMGW